jgi:hypothetical protein
LQLDIKHKPVSQEELSVLAKRALIRLPAPDNESSSSSMQKLRQDLGNMLHMIQQVQDFVADNADEPLTDADIYDRPRGVKAAPVRRETSAAEEEEEEASQVWESLLKPKTTAVGAHSYFVIATKRDT